MFVKVDGKIWARNRKEYTSSPGGPANLLIQGHELNLLLLRTFSVLVIFFMFLFSGFDRVAEAEQNRDEEEIQECMC